MSTTGPLKGVRIVEFAGIGPGPFAAMMLGDMGADIVRIERPGTVTDPRDLVMRSRSAVVQIDLKSPSGQQAALALLGLADALIEGFRPGVMERLLLGPADVMACNPRLVYGRMTGWGQIGPLARSAGHDINYISLSGALAAMGPADRPPPPPLNLVGDYGGGAMYLLVGLLAALLHARLSHHGQVIDAAMCDGSASLMTHFFAAGAMGQWSSRRNNNLLDGGAPFYATYTCQDGLHVAVGAIEPQFYAVLRENLQLTDPMFDHPEDKTDWPAMQATIARIFATQPREYWCRLFDGTDGCVTAVRSQSEAALDPHLAARHTFVTQDGILQPAPAPRFSLTPSGIQSSPATKYEPIDTVLDRWLAKSRC